VKYLTPLDQYPNYVNVCPDWWPLCQVLAGSIDEAIPAQEEAFRVNPRAFRWIIW
jgi:hypothetical protein